ncbi:hypothetical protein M413DRAFT_449460 [Hebeloma cylindrosporum]|uniref:Uncharacterized protein n=1 Tax=Hebeloma cylindrosporum TaxID=76867 RepID=A0A0C2XDJ8_HEBCY|nr:hypothetical protein M413DRAFT_449460 [Hebeloma cylindrosporum h7]
MRLAFNNRQRARERRKSPRLRWMVVAFGEERNAWLFQLAWPQRIPTPSFDSDYRAFAVLNLGRFRIDPLIYAISTESSYLQSYICLRASQSTSVSVR